MSVHGSTYSPAHDGNLMLDGKWRTLTEIQAVTGGSEASVSARLRELRNDYKYTIDRERKESLPSQSGVWVYRLSYQSDESGQLRLPGAA